MQGEPEVMVLAEFTYIENPPAEIIIGGSIGLLLALLRSVRGYFMWRREMDRRVRIRKTREGRRA